MHVDPNNDASRSDGKVAAFRPLQVRLGFIMAHIHTRGMVPAKMQRIEPSLSEPQASFSELLDHVLGWPGNWLVHRNIEHSPTSDVKKPMDRMKVIVASFLPTLWLVTSGQCLLDPVGPCAWISASESGKDSPWKHACSFLAAARPVNLRIGAQSGPDRVPSSETFSCSRILELARLTISSPSSELPLAR